ncbi:MAG TPA: aminotransferase class V-fold PLP-dependent enzyme [Solirubrobacteraceae bacterium]|nr:aminotransferase class V-fold PLP-dependent enzyme [Solirubrobacteraceae bacterium]
MDASSLRGEFPALERLAYFNTGTNGPLPQAAARAAERELRQELEQGRTHASFDRKSELASELREAYASLLHCDTADLALTTCTSEGLAQVLDGLELQAGDEILTSDEEHPGLLGALGAARELRGVSVRMAPLPQITEAVGPRTRLVACSHVSWVSGLLAPAELSELDVPVVLDGAQGVGAIPVDVGTLRCDAYAGAGQKWLCGPNGSGMLYVSPQLRARLRVTRRGYLDLADPNEGLAARPHDDARRFDAMALSSETLACARAAVGVLQAAGLGAVQARARDLAARLAGELARRGREPAPRDDTTLVSFQSPDPEGERLRLAERAVIVRNIPGRPWLRASVGGWNSEDDLDRLLEAL